MKVSKISAFFSRGTGHVSRAIAYASAPIGKTLRRELSTVPSHGGLKIDFDGEQPAAAAEAHLQTDWQIIPWQEISDKRQSDPKRGLWLVALDFEAWQRQAIWDRCNYQLGMWDYNAMQILALYAWRRGFKKPAKSYKVDCTEAVSRILYPFMDCKALAGVDRHDTVTPWNLFSGFKNEGYEIDLIDSAENKQ